MRMYRFMEDNEFTTVMNICEKINKGIHYFLRSIWEVFVLFTTGLMYLLNSLNYIYNDENPWWRRLIILCFVLSAQYFLVKYWIGTERNNITIKNNTI